MNEYYQVLYSQLWHNPSGMYTACIVG